MSTPSRFFFFFFSSILIANNRPATGVRPLGHGLQPHPPPQPPESHYRQLAFFMSDVLGGGQPSPKPDNAERPNFRTPGVLYPAPVGRIRPADDHRKPATDPDVPSDDIWFAHDPSSLQALEFGAVTVVDEQLREAGLAASPLVGRARGIYVTVPQDAAGCMMAVTAKFDGDDPESSIMLFGIRRLSGAAAESHVAVIGGTGKYEGANGYATVKSVGIPDRNDGGGGGGPSPKALLITAFLI